jgi:hypothetical protein
MVKETSMSTVRFVPASLPLAMIAATVCTASLPAAAHASPARRLARQGVVVVPVPVAPLVVGPTVAAPATPLIAIPQHVSPGLLPIEPPPLAVPQTVALHHRPRRAELL